MAKHACKCKEVECEECPEWIFTLADLIMCMMGLFVILWCLKPGADAPLVLKPENMELIKQLDAIRNAFQYDPSINPNDPVDLYKLLRRLQELDPHQGPGKGANNDAPEIGINGPYNMVANIRPGDIHSIGAAIPFEARQAALTPLAVEAIKETAQKVKGFKQIVIVKGHAEKKELPEGATAQDYMDLSIRRVQVVMDRLAAEGVEPETLRLMGCSTNEPVVAGVYQPDERQRNRRVEVQVLDQLVLDRAAQPAAASPGAGESAAKEPAEHGEHK